MQSSCRPASPFGISFPVISAPVALPGIGLPNLWIPTRVRIDARGRDPSRVEALVQLPEGVPTVRRLVLLTAVAVMAITAVAYAVTDTITYTSKTTFKGTPSAKKPVNVTYQGILHIDTDPQGQQPDTAPRTSVYYAKGYKTNAKYFPFCNSSEIDGHPTLPAKCNKAIVGSGTASALAGRPGTTGSSIRENLTVKAMNGPKGKTLYLVLNSTPDAPVAIQNRVVPGTVVKSSGAFAFLIRFDVPADLQEQLGLRIALTDFNVKISGTPRKVKIGKVFKSVSYLQLTSCKGSLPVKAIAQFKDSANGDNIKPVTNTSSAKC